MSAVGRLTCSVLLVLANVALMLWAMAAIKGGTDWQWAGMFALILTGDISPRISQWIWGADRP